MSFPTQQEILLGHIRSGDCWIWEGRVDHNGYGVVVNHAYKSRGEYAHRAAYRLFVGPIADGLYVLHSCDMPHCVNPDHLHLGTHADNMREAAERGLMERGSRRYNSKLTEHSVKEMRRRSSNGEPQRSLAREFGVSQSAVSLACARRRWTHV